MTNLDKKIESILDKLWNDAMGKVGLYQFDGTGEDTLTKLQAKNELIALISDKEPEAMISYPKPSVEYVKSNGG